MKPEKIGFIGLGLIGGSIAKAIHRIHPDITLIAYDIDAEALSLALAEQVISQGFQEITEDFAGCVISFYVRLSKKILNFSAPSQNLLGSAASSQMLEASKRRSTKRFPTPGLRLISLADIRWQVRKKAGMNMPALIFLKTPIISLRPLQKSVRKR